MRKGRVRVGDFLEANPDFFFDIEEYVISTKYIPLLKSRWARFVASLARGGGSRATPESLLDGIKKGECRDVPAYRSYEKFDDFQSIPFITKNDLRAHPDQFISSAFAREQLWCKATSGTTGPPIPIWYSPEFYFELLHLSLRKVAARAGIHGLGGRPFFCLSISDIPTVADSVFVDPTDEVGLILQVVVDASRPETIARAFELMRVTRPECVSTKPSLFELLVEYGCECGGLGEHAPSFVVSGGHLLGEKLREDLRLMFRAPVVDVYGMTEVGLIASECRGGQLHLNDLSFCAEVADGDGRAADSAGELILSSLDNLAMPLLRYRTGDQAQIARGLCACGDTGPRLVNFFGRRIRCFVLSTGEKLSPTYFNDLFVRFPALVEFQIAQKDYDSFELAVEFKLGVGARDEILREISAHVAGLLPPAAHVTAAERTFRGAQKFERYLTLVEAEPAAR